MASTAGNGSTETSFKAGSVLPHNAGTSGGFNSSMYVSKGGKRSRQQQEGGALAFSELKGGKSRQEQQQQQGGALAFSELKGGKKRRSRKTSRKSSRKTSSKRGKKTMKTMLKGLFGVFKK